MLASAKLLAEKECLQSGFDRYFKTNCILKKEEELLHKILQVHKRIKGKYVLGGLGISGKIYNLFLLDFVAELIFSKILTSSFLFKVKFWLISYFFLFLSSVLSKSVLIFLT